MKTIGLIINPVAGMGGSVGLKGTDGGLHRRALAMGAAPVTPQRTREMLAHVTQREAIAWLAAPGSMGEDCLEDSGVSYRVVGDIDAETAADDTRRIAALMADAGAELLVCP